MASRVPVVAANRDWPLIQPVRRGRRRPVSRGSRPYTPLKSVHLCALLCILVRLKDLGPVMMQWQGGGG